MSRHGLTLLAACVLTAGCGGTPTSPSVSSLQSAPLSVALAGKTLSLGLFAQRNFQPLSVDSSLELVVTLKTSDSSAVPSSVSVDAVWALKGSTVWSKWTLLPQQGNEPDYVVVATNGPSWEVNTLISVVVRLKDAGGNTLLVRAPSQAIVAAW